MRSLFTRSFARALTITLVSALIIIGGASAYETIWAGTAHITIVEPSSEAELEITGVSVSEGTWDSNTNTWTVSLKRGDWAALFVYLKNTGGDAIVVHGEINGESSPSIGAFAGSSVGAETLSAGESGTLVFQFAVKADASPGAVPDIELAIVEGPA